MIPYKNQTEDQVDIKFAMTFIAAITITLLTSFIRDEQKNLLEEEIQMAHQHNNVLEQENDMLLDFIDHCMKKEDNVTLYQKLIDRLSLSPNGITTKELVKEMNLTKNELNHHLYTLKNKKLISSKEAPDTKASLWYI
jgi:predicted HTH transcriptional regulator